MTDDTTATATFLPEYKISVDPKSLNFKNLKKDVPSDIPDRYRDECRRSRSDSYRPR